MGPGQGKQAGDQPGQDYYETEISLTEVEEALFKELELPNLEEERANGNRLRILNLMIFEKKDLSVILIKNEQF